MTTLNTAHRLGNASAAFTADGDRIAADDLAVNGYGAARCICGDQSTDLASDERPGWITLHRAAVVWQIRNGERPDEGYPLPPEFFPTPEQEPA